MSLSKKDQQMLKLLELEQQTRLYKNYVEGGHKKPKTRREFLASGLAASSAYMFMPTLLQLLTQHNAHAAEVECVSSSAATNTLPAFINIQLAGGPALFAQHLVCGAGGALDLSQHNTMLGIIPNAQNFFANSAPFWFENDPSVGSQMIRSIVNRTNGTDIMGKSSFIAVAAKSTDDTAANPNDITGLLEKAGLIGTTFPYFFTGNHPRFSQPAILPAATSLNVANLASLQNSVGFQGALATFSGDPATNISLQQRLIASVQRLTKIQVEQLVTSSKADRSQDTFKKLVACSTEKNTKVISETTGVDIYNNYPGGPEFANIWQRNMSPSFNTTLETCGLAISNCLRGMSGGAMVTLGGYDYHAPALRSEADQKDAEAGEIIARTLLTARQANRKVFIYVSADGSLNNAAGNGAAWGGDFGERGVHYIIAYDPAGAPATRGLNIGGYADAPFQLNHFAGTSVATSNPIAATDAQDLCASAVFLNYLSFAGLKAKIDAPELTAVKSKLLSSLPAGGGDIFNYYLRIAG
ncbi:MAG: hypothetical protein K2Q26_03450 [Bdellovibrionales bacterium]|nr:hypothetical protein [Bdellovibrionales bacterium]